MYTYYTRPPYLTLKDLQTTLKLSYLDVGDVALQP